MRLTRITRAALAVAGLLGGLMPLSSICAAPGPGQVSGLGLAEAIELARQQDPWLEGSRLRQQALAASEVAAGSLPDPVVSLGAANLPVDTFDLDQEAMTQLRVGVSQALPRGDTLSLAQQRLALLGEQQVLARAERRAQLAVSVTGLWLDAYLAQESIRLIQADRALFEYLVEVAQRSYANAVGGTRQQDVVRAQLELTRLDERVAALSEQRDIALGQLWQWLGGDAAGAGPGTSVDHSLPDLPLRAAEQVRAPGAIDSDWLSGVLRAHPAIGSLEQEIAASEVDVDLARQQYKPQWGVDVSYGYREDEPVGAPRADFFSLGLSFDLPLFTGRRQDPQVEAATARAGAGRTDRALALRRLRAGFHSQRARLQQLELRDTLYRERLLTQMREQSEAALTAYTSDEGDFAEVVRARIDELNARVDALALRVQRLQAVAELNYYLAGLEARPSAREGKQ